jgi:hypothetical protein
MLLWGGPPPSRFVHLTEPCCHSPMQRMTSRADRALVWLTAGTGVLLPWATAAGVKLHLQAQGKPTWPWWTFARFAPVGLLLSAIYVAPFYALALLARAWALGRIRRLAPASPLQRHLVLLIALAGGAVGMVRVFVDVFWVFDPSCSPSSRSSSSATSRGWGVARHRRLGGAPRRSRLPPAEPALAPERLMPVRRAAPAAVPLLCQAAATESRGVDAGTRSGQSSLSQLSSRARRAGSLAVSAQARARPSPPAWACAAR